MTPESRPLIHTYRDPLWTALCERAKRLWRYLRLDVDEDDLSALRGPLRPIKERWEWIEPDHPRYSEARHGCFYHPSFYKGALQWIDDAQESSELLQSLERENAKKV